MNRHFMPLTVLSFLFISSQALAGKADLLASATMGENISGGFGDFYIQSKDSFNADSREVIWFGNFKGFMTAYQANLNAEWITPAGETFKKEKFTTRYGNARYGWAKLDIKGTDKTALELEGEWKVKIFWDDELIDQRHFYMGDRKFAKIAIPEEPVAPAEQVGTAEGYIRLAQVYFKKNEMDKAVDSLLRAEAVEPEKPAAYLVLGSIYNSIGKPDDAVLQFSKAQSLNADPVAVHRGLGDSYFKMDLYQEAVKEYEQVVQSARGSKEDADKLTAIRNRLKPADGQKPAGK